MVRIITDFQFANYLLCLTLSMSWTCNMFPEGRYMYMLAVERWSFFFVSLENWKWSYSDHDPWLPVLSHGIVLRSKNKTSRNCFRRYEFGHLVISIIHKFTRQKHSPPYNSQVHNTSGCYRWQIWSDLKNYKHRQLANY